jgi:orotate phosphoribosyltransferase
MPSEELMKMFEKAGAIVTGSHIVYAKKETGWHHGTDYVNKDVISMDPRLLMKCAEEMNFIIPSDEETRRQIDFVVSPAAGAVGWGEVLAYQMSNVRRVISFAFAEKEPDPKDLKDHIFKFRQIFADRLKGKGVLIAEDITNPGTSVKKVANAVELCGGKVIAAAVLCNRVGKKAHEYLAPIPLFAVTEVEMPMWHENECPLCQQGVPLNMSLGKAKDWLATEKGQAWAGKCM